MSMMEKPLSVSQDEEVKVLKAPPGDGWQVRAQKGRWVITYAADGQWTLLNNGRSVTGGKKLNALYELADMVDAALEAIEQIEDGEEVY